MEKGAYLHASIHAYTYALCISHPFLYCDKIPGKKQLKEKKDLFGSYFDGWSELLTFLGLTYRVWVKVNLQDHGSLNGNPILESLLQHGLTPLNSGTVKLSAQLSGN